MMLFLSLLYPIASYIYSMISKLMLNYIAITADPVFWSLFAASLLIGLLLLRAMWPFLKDLARLGRTMQRSPRLRDRVIGSFFMIPAVNVLFSPFEIYGIVDYLYYA